MLLLHKVVHAQRLIRELRVNLRFDVPEDLTLRVRALCELEYFFQSRYARARVCELEC